MVWRKRRPAKKTYRKRYYYKKRAQKKRNNGKKVYYYKRSSMQKITLTNVSSGIIHLNSENGTYNSYTFSGIPGSTDFTNLYDSYKLCAIQRKYIFDKNVSTIGSTTEIPRLVTVNDYNDSSPLVDEAKALEYQTYKTSRLNHVVKRYGRLMQKIDSDYMARPHYIPCTTVNAHHMFLKEMVVINNPGDGSTTLGELNIITTYYFKMKTVK